MSDPSLQIDLWDVGQGDCTVIKLPSGKLLIIDVGPRGSPLVDWLNERRNEAVRIEGIVLTHNDADHAGALPSIIMEYWDRIEGIWMLLDREVGAPQFQKIFRSALQGEKRGFYRIRRLENGQTLWEDETRQDRLHVIYPGFSEKHSSNRSE